MNGYDFTLELVTKLAGLAMVAFIFFGVYRIVNKIINGETRR